MASNSESVPAVVVAVIGSPRHFVFVGSSARPPVGSSAVTLRPRFSARVPDEDFAIDPAWFALEQLQQLSIPLVLFGVLCVRAVVLLTVKGDGCDELGGVPGVPAEVAGN